jgi:succinate dehydrogenase / fumarate reductase iron-sulfur subunit
VNLTLHVWRQPSASAEGRMVEYAAPDISPDMSFLEMLDVVNERLIEAGDQPIAFDHDCREGICGTCGLVINGIAHGPQRATTACQLHMRHFNDGETIFIEPWRAQTFPIIKDLIVDRSAFDRIIEAACIGCGACVAACPNASAMLFTAAKISHLGALPQGQPERQSRVLSMVAKMDELGFGSCTNIGECAAVCPKEISMDTIATLNRDLIRASLRRS